MSSPPANKEYPRNGVYSQSYKPAFQPTSKTNQQKKIVNISGTSLSQLGYLSNNNNYQHTHVQTSYQTVSKGSTGNLKSIKNSIHVSNNNSNTSTNAHAHPNGNANVSTNSNTNPNKSSNTTNATQISILHQRIQYLEKQLQMVTQLLIEQQSRKSSTEKLEKRIEDITQNLEKTQQINKMLENQLIKSESSNQELVNALKYVNEELQIMKSEHNDSKHSRKSKEQVQEDIIKLNQQISNILTKLQTLNQDYQMMQQKNYMLENQKLQYLEQISQLNNQLSQQKNQNKGETENQVIAKYQSQQLQLQSIISQLEQSLNESAKNVQKYKSEYEYKCEQVGLLKQEIQQVNQLSIRKQKQMQDEHQSRQKALNEQIQKIKNELRQSKISISSKISSKKQVESQSSGSNLVEIKNVMIRKLELDNQVIRQQLESLQRENRRIKDNQKLMERQYSNQNKRVSQLTSVYKQRIFQLEQEIKNKHGEHEQQNQNIRYYEQKISVLEAQNRQSKSESRSKQQKIYLLQEQVRELKNQLYMLDMLQQQVKELRSKQNGNQVYEIQRKRLSLMQQLNSVRRQLENIQYQVKTTNETKQAYAIQIKSLKSKMRQLEQDAKNQANYIKNLQNSQQTSRKKLQDTPINMVKVDAAKFTTQQMQNLQYTNKQLQKMLIDEKLQKQNQNKRYKQLLQDYKQLNHELTLQLQLYRDSTNIDHPHCPLPLPPHLVSNVKDSRQKSIISRKSDQSNSSQIRKQLQKQKTKYYALLEQHEKTLLRYKNIQQKMHQLQKNNRQSNFLKIDNSSLRAQVTQQNIRIQEYKNMIQILNKQSDNRHIDAQRLRFALQRQYENKLQIQRMDIINQYNVLLRNRNVRIQPHQFKSNKVHEGNFVNKDTFNPFSNQIKVTTHTNTNGNEFKPNQNDRQIKNETQIFEVSYTGIKTPKFILESKIRHHPQYKNLQEQYMKIYRRLLQTQQYCNKVVTQHRDQIQKLKIQNQYHRKTIDQMHAEGYGIYDDESNSQRNSFTNSHSHKDDQFKNMYEQLNRNYQKLYNQYVALKTRQGQNSTHLSVHQNHGSLQIKRPSTSYVNHAQKSEVGILKKIIDEKLIQLQLTPRQSTSTIQRAVWLIQRLAQLVQQLKQDINILKNQKKELNKQIDKLKVKAQTVQYQNGHLLKQLSVVAQKFKYLQQRNMKIANGSHTSFESSHKNSMQPQVPKINLNKNGQSYANVGNTDSLNTNHNIKIINTNNTLNTKNSNNVNSTNLINNQKDVYFHEAKLIREQRLALLRKYEKDIESLDKQI